MDSLQLLPVAPAAGSQPDSQLRALHLLNLCWLSDSGPCAVCTTSSMRNRAWSGLLRGIVTFHQGLARVRCQDMSSPREARPPGWEECSPRFSYLSHGSPSTPVGQTAILQEFQRSPCRLHLSTCDTLTRGHVCSSCLLHSSRLRKPTLAFGVFHPACPSPPSLPAGGLPSGCGHGCVG